MKTIRVLLVALVAIGCIAIGISRADNYNATAGSGLSFLAKLIGGNLLPLVAVCDYQNGSPACGGVTQWGSAPIASASAQNVNANILASTPLTVNATVVNASNDPCLGVKNASAISTSAGNFQLVSGATNANVTLCSIALISDVAVKFSIIEGTGGTCTGGTEVAVFGSTTAASGMSFAANGGYTYGAGVATIGKTHTTGNGMCILQSGTSLLGGGFTFIQQ